MNGAHDIFKIAAMVKMVSHTARLKIVVKSFRLFFQQLGNSKTVLQVTVASLLLFRAHGFYI